MKGPEPSQQQIKNNRRDQLSIGFSRTFAWEEIGRWVSRSRDSLRAVRFWGRGNQLALRAIRGCSSLMIPSMLKLLITGRVVKAKAKIWVDPGVALTNNRELRVSYKGQTLKEKHLKVVSGRDGSQGDQTLFSQISFLHCEDYTRVDRGITETLMRCRAFSVDWGRIQEDSIGQWVRCKHRLGELRSLRQNLGSRGRTPVHRWNRHG